MNNKRNRNESECIQNSNNCVGCGVCSVVFDDKCKMELGQNGTYNVKFLDTVDDEIFSELCPVTNNHYMTSDIWGNIEQANLAYATDESVRFKGSSGGVITALAIFLLKEKYVDGIIQVRADDNNPLNNIVQISRSSEDVLKCCGSRYAPVSIFSNIFKELSAEENYCLIGKPCDIRAFKNYIATFPDNNLNIKYTLSFFCAGVPSAKATLDVLDKMHIKDTEVKQFDYRGNGWPGYTQAICKDGNVCQMEYNESWGSILGRNLHSACKFCVDGVGVSADISCGDAWFSDEKGYPIFQEADGRNIVLIRSRIGNELFDKAVSKGYINSSPVDDVLKMLEKIQPYQYKRKALMYTKIRMLRLFGKYTPQYDRTLKKWDKQVPLGDKVTYAKGTLERILKKKIK